MSVHTSAAAMMTPRKLHEFARREADPFEKPPPATIRYFYSSSTSIDDPQAPIPPPAAAGASSQHLQLQPFSEYDSTALDKAWIELRRNIHDYEEEKRAKEVKGKHSGRQRASSLIVARPGTEQHYGDAVKQEPRNAASHRRHVSESQGRQQGLKQFAPTPFHETSTDTEQEVQGLTGRPFARAPSRSKLSTRYMSSMDRGMLGDEVSPKQQLKETRETEPSKTVAVGVARLHEVMMPNLQYVSLKDTINCGVHTNLY